MFSFLILAGLALKYRSGVREGFMRAGRRIWLYMAPIYIVSALLIIVLIYVKSARDWPAELMVLITVFISASVFLLKEARPHSANLREK